VLADVRQALRDDEVGGGLHLVGQPFVRRGDHPRGNGRACGEILQRGVEAPVAEDRGMDAAGQVAQLLQREAGLLPRLAHELGCLGIARGRALLGHAQVERQGDEALLRAIVEVALDPPALRVRRLDDAGARVAEVRHLGGESRVHVRAEKQLGVGAVQAADRAEDGDPDPQHHGADRNQQERLRPRIHLGQPDLDAVGDGPVPERRRQRGSAHAQHGDRDDQRQEAKRELQQEEGQVLPGGRVGEPGP
jgi:hypothetical protein